MSDSIIILDSDSSFNDSIGVDQSIIDLTEDTLPIEPRLEMLMQCTIPEID